jgi:hypothetical protein
MRQTVETEFRDGQQGAKAAELQDAPKMVRGLIRHGIRGSIPKDEQDSFVLLYQDEDVWKILADFSDPNNAYSDQGQEPRKFPCRHISRAASSAYLNT